MFTSKKKIRVAAILTCLVAMSFTTGCGNDPIFSPGISGSMGPLPAASPSPVPTPIVIPPFVGPIFPSQVVSGEFHSCRSFSNGKVKCWGYNAFGQLGLGHNFVSGDDADEVENSLTLDFGSGLRSIALAAGGYFTCALLENYTVKCWGQNSSGQLGQGDTLDRGVNSGEMGNFLGTIDFGTNRYARAISAGRYHACAILDNGSVKCWGNNGSGRLGLGDTFNRGNNPGEMGDNLPTVFLGNGRTAVAISAGADHSCAVLDNGSLKCWGENIVGQLGQGHTFDIGNNPGEMAALQPIDLGSGRTAISVSAGENTTCALLDNNTIKCFGWNIYGQLGQGDTDYRGDNPGEMGNSLPTILLGTNRTALKVVAKREHVCAILDDLSVKCWGNNIVGQLGQGSTDSLGDSAGELGDILEAVRLGTGRSVVDVSVGNYFSCAILDNGATKCWGDNLYGQLGLGDIVIRGDGPGEMGDYLPFITFGSVN